VISGQFLLFSLSGPGLTANRGTSLDSFVARVLSLLVAPTYVCDAVLLSDNRTDCSALSIVMIKSSILGKAKI
jgi:hypothetical protein